MINKTSLIVFVVYLILKFITVAEMGDRRISTISVLDVGQGDATLIELGDKRILIDGGPDFEVDRYLNRRFVINKCYLDAIVLTHPHSDHLNGLTRILERCQVGTVIYNDLGYSSSVYNYFKELTEVQDVKTVTNGDYIFLDGARLIFLWPDNTRFPNLVNENVNNDSIVVLFDHKNFEALFMGDLEFAGSSKIDWEKISNEYIQDGLDVYKVPHHGAKNGINQDIFSILKPKVCLLSVGKNNYFGHPHSYTLEMLDSYGCTVYRTDDDGTVEVSIN